MPLWFFAAYLQPFMPFLVRRLGTACSHEIVFLKVQQSLSQIKPW
jgi:hypothetical protein